jgi:hypothetical protein
MMMTTDAMLDEEAGVASWSSSYSLGTKTMLDDCCSAEAMIGDKRDPAGSPEGRGRAAVLGAADVLRLAAAPTFAVMALLTGALAGSAPHMICSAASDASPLSGMAPMYLLMTAFHSAPWLKLIASR